MPALAARIVVSAATAGLLLVPWMPARILGTLVVIGLLPGLATLGRPRRGDRTGLGITIALAPHFFAAAVVLGLVVGAGIEMAAWLATGFWLVVFITRGDWPVRKKRPSTLTLLSLLVIAAAGVVWIGPVLAGGGWQPRSESWFNAAVAARLLRDGLPLLDPYFTPLRLDAAYAYHAAVAAASSLSGAGVPGGAIVLNLAALFGFGAGFGALTGLFARRLWPRVLALVLALLAMNGLDVFGAANPAALAPGPLCVLLGLMVAARRGWWDRRLAIAWTLVFPALLLVHIPLGLVVLAVTLSTLGFLHVIRAHPEPGGPAYATLIGLALAGAIATAPYLWSAMPHGGPPVRFGWYGPAAAASMSLIGLLLLAIPFARWQARSDTPPPGQPEIVTGRLYAGFSFAAAGLLWSWLMGMVVLSFFVSVPTGSLFAWLLFLPLAVFATGGLERLWSSLGGRALALILVALAIATPGSVVALRGAFAQANPLEITEHEQAVYQWIQRSAPQEAVFFEHDDVVRVPLMGVRDQYWGDEHSARLRRYSNYELVVRRRMRDAIFSDRGISMEQARVLRALGRPIYVVYRSRPDDLYDASQMFRERPAYEGRFATPTISVYELQLNP